MLAHGAVLRKNGFTAQQIIALLDDYHNAGLSPAEVHMMDYAAKISDNADSITAADVDQLRQDGLTDQQITDVALAAVARNFMSRFFHAVGAAADPELQQQEPELWDYLKDWPKARCAECTNSASPTSRSIAPTAISAGQSMRPSMLSSSPHPQIT